MLSGFSKISKSLHEHTIGSAINIPTRAYNVCADSDFVFDARPIAYPSFSPCQFSVHANPPSPCVCMYMCICRCLQRISIALPFPCHCSLLFAGKIRYAGRFLFSRDFYAVFSILSPLLFSFDRGLRLFRALLPLARLASIRYTRCIFLFVDVQSEGLYLCFKRRRLNKIMAI